MLKRLVNAIKNLFGGDDRLSFDMTDERRRMMIDFQRRDYIND